MVMDSMNARGYDKQQVATQELTAACFMVL